MPAVNWPGRRVLLAGGAGFVGSALARLLADYGAHVVVLDDYSSGCPTYVPIHKNVESLEGDACDLSLVRKLFHSYQFEFVFHCIGDTFVPEAYEFPERFFQRNVGSTLNLLRAAGETDGLRRMLYVSSTEVYGEIRAEHADESCHLLPVNTYAVSKMAADRLCYTYYLEHKVPVIIARIFNCYGPRTTHPYIIPEIIRQLHEGKVLQLGNVVAERDFTYVDDTARALVDLIDSSLANGDVVNVGSGHAHSVASLVERVARLLGVEDARIELDPSRLRRHDISRFCADSSKLRKATGWEPRVSLDAGLQMTIDYFRKNGCRWSRMRCG